MAISAMGISAQLKEKDTAHLADDVRLLAMRVSKALAGGIRPGQDAG
jgi:hypothetical protein